MERRSDGRPVGRRHSHARAQPHEAERQAALAVQNPEEKEAALKELQASRDATLESAESDQAAAAQLSQTKGAIDVASSVQKLMKSAPWRPGRAACWC